MRSPIINFMYYLNNNKVYLPLQTRTHLDDIFPAAGKLRAQRFIDLAESTDERTWQGLAWETQARAALAQGGAREAREHIAKALAASEEFDKPLADWRML